MEARFRLVLSALEQFSVTGVDFQCLENTVQSLPLQRALVREFVVSGEISDPLHKQIRHLYSLCFASDEHWNQFEQELTEFLMLYRDQVSPSTVATPEAPTCDECSTLIHGESFRCLYCLQHLRCSDCYHGGSDEHEGGGHIFVKIPSGKTFRWDDVWRFRKAMVDSMLSNRNSLTPNPA